MNAPIYTTEILRLASSLAGFRPLAVVHGRAQMRSPTCGSAIATEVALTDDGRVAAMTQDVRACAFGQAAAALVDRGAGGKPAAEVERALADVREWLGGRREDPGSWPGLDALSPARSKTARHAAMLLPFQALVKAMRG